MFVCLCVSLISNTICCLRLTHFRFVISLLPAFFFSLASLILVVVFQFCFFLFHFVYSSPTDIHLLVFNDIYAHTHTHNVCLSRIVSFDCSHLVDGLSGLKLYSTQFSLTLQFCHPFRWYRFCFGCSPLSFTETFVRLATINWCPVLFVYNAMKRTSTSIFVLFVWNWKIISLMSEWK